MFRNFSISIISILFSLSVFAEGPSFTVDIILSPAGSFKGTSTEVTGYAEKTASGSVVAENIVIDLKNLTTGVGLRDKHTKEHLQVDKYPQAKLIKASGSGGKGTAEIMVRGKTVTVSGTYTETANTLHATFDMKLSDIDVTNVRYMGIGVKDKATVNITVPLQPQAAAPAVKAAAPAAPPPAVMAAPTKPAASVKPAAPAKPATPAPKATPKK